MTVRDFLAIFADVSSILGITLYIIDKIMQKKINRQNVSPCEAVYFN